MDEVEGKTKEANGALVGDEDKKAEGRALQGRASAGKEVKQRETTRQTEVEAKQAETARDRQRLRDKGALGDLTDSLLGR